MKRTNVVLIVVAAYVGVSSLLHYVVFPEPYPNQSDLPRRGMTVINENIHSKFVFRQTPIETGGRVFEIDSFIEPGGGPIAFPHVHPRMRETFIVMEGNVRFVVDGEERIVRAGSEIVVEPGSAHGFQSSSDRSAYVVARLEAVREGPWMDLAGAGLLPDSAFVQMDRAGGIGGVSPAQMIVFANRYKDVYPPTLPSWLVDAVSFLVAPTARLFGVRVYYPPRAGAE